MASPLPSEDPTRGNWLAKYVAVQQAYDKEIVKALTYVADDCAAAALKLSDKDSVSARVARYQNSLVRKEIANTIRKFYAKSMYSIIKRGQIDAVEAAAKASLKHDASILKMLFPIAKERKQFEASFEQAAKQGIDAMIHRIINPQWPLSERVWNAGVLASGVLDRKINSAIARGLSAKQLADSVKSDVNYGAPGGTSYSAMRLARTEINNAFHAQSIAGAQEQPWVQEIEWHLSKSHNEQGCLCEFYARERFFEKTDVPPKPHPQCMCYVTPVSMGWDSFAEQFKAGSFNTYFESKYKMPAA